MERAMGPGTAKPWAFHSQAGGIGWRGRAHLGMFDLYVCIIWDVQVCRNSTVYAKRLCLMTSWTVYIWLSLCPRLRRDIRLLYFEDDGFARLLLVVRLTVCYHVDTHVFTTYVLFDSSNLRNPLRLPNKNR